MKEIKRRVRREQPAEETRDTRENRRTSVTLTKDVSSRYRKIMPKAQPGGGRPRPSSGGAGRGRPEGPRPSSGPRPATSPRGGPRQNGASEAMKALVHRELPETARRVREVQDLLRSAAEDLLTGLEVLDSRLRRWAETAARLGETAGSGGLNAPPEGLGQAQAMLTSLFEKISFQDLAGQRLNKVEDFLKALAEVVALAPAAARPAGPKKYPAGPRKYPAAPRKYPAAGQLKGPQAAGRGLSQKSADKLLAGS